MSEKDILILTGKKYRYDKTKLKKLLEDDYRFKSVDEDKWETIPLEDLFEDKPVKETAFIITDIETTGPAQGTDKIIDIAAIKYINGQIEEEFETLVNPHKHIPSVIVNLTGIDQTMVNDAPDIEEVLPGFISFVGKGVFTAHNSEFDYSFINCELKNLGFPLMHVNPELCTLNIAKKLLPELNACGLNGLAKHFDYAITGRHRAMADVLATKFFMEKFLEMLDSQGVDTLFGLLEFQRNVMTRKEFKKLVKKRIRRRSKQYKQTQL